MWFQKNTLYCSIPKMSMIVKPPQKYYWNKKRVLLSAPFQSGPEAEWCSVGLVTTNRFAETSQRSRLGCTSGSITQPESFPKGLCAISRFKSLIQMASTSLARTEGHLHFASRCMLYIKKHRNSLVPWTEEPGGLQSMASQGVGYATERLGTQYT